MYAENLIIYQIYPRSFKDTTGNGVGDIQGVIRKLDYIKSLGVDGIWLSPINTSPMFDFGYDISDYRGIDPTFGSMSDCEELIEECKKHKLLLMMDLVVNHSSHLHNWFKESSSSKENAKRDWYMWHPGKTTFFHKLLGLRPAPPNNWLGLFGGGAWKWDEKTKEYYYHSFLVEQPDINWRNAEVKKAIFSEIEFWLKKGVSGFRLDVVNFFIKDKKLRNNPWKIGKTPRPYDMQKHIYNRNQEELNDVLKEFRLVLDQYENTVSVGEVYSEAGNPKMSASTLGNGKDQLHLAFDFSLIYAKFCAVEFHSKIQAWHQSIPKDGNACHVFSNHDQVRSKSRYGFDKKEDNKAKIIAMLLLGLKGSAFIYYGEEIGMTDGKVSRSELVDPVGKKYWPFHPGRDPQRTPMQWDNSKNAGFSATKPWLPINKNHKTVNVDKQESEPNSLLNFYRKMIALKKNEAALSKGDFKLLPSNPNILGFTRCFENEEVLVLLNFKNKPVSIPNPVKSKAAICLLSSNRKNVEKYLLGEELKLSAHEAIMLKLS